jgi:ribonuclease HII
MKEYENKYYSEGYSVVAGTDEAGRGPLVGPVVCACVAFPKDYDNEEINDSKKLTPKKRERLYDIIMNDALAVGISIIPASKIDEINILEASRLGMKNAYLEVNKKIHVDILLTDAMDIDLSIPVIKIIKGDAKSISIAAASIIAKVTRDRILDELDEKYPMYGFKKHKGYPTKAHLEAINKYGIFDEYRKTYGPVKRIIEK